MCLNFNSALGNEWLSATPCWSLDPGPRAKNFMVLIWRLCQHSNPSIKHQPWALQPGNKKLKACFRAITQTFANQHLSCSVRSEVIQLRKKKPAAEKHHTSRQVEGKMALNSSRHVLTIARAGSIYRLIPLPPWEQPGKRTPGGLRSVANTSCAKFTWLGTDHHSEDARGTQGYQDMTKPINFVHFYSKDQLWSKS